MTVPHLISSMLIVSLINQALGSGEVLKTSLYLISKIYISVKWFQTYRIQSTKAVYESFSDKFLLNVTIDRIKGLTVYLNLLEEFNELYTDVSLVVDLNNKNEYDFDVVRRTINTCRLFKEPTYEPVVQFLYKLFLGNGNFPTKCPIKKVGFHLCQL